MNLLQLLLQVMLAKNSVNSVSNKTGINSALVKKLMLLAVPMLIKYMTKNVSSQSGAQSLLGALMKHTSTRSVSEQIDEVDEEDGQKIIGHILGDDKAKVVGELATETGLKIDEVSKGLGAIAPALLSGLSAATASAANNSTGALDLSSLLGTFAGSKPTQQDQTFGLDDVLGLFLAQQQPVQQKPQSPLGSLFGGSKPAQQAQPTDLLNALLSASAQQSKPSQSNLLGTLLSGGQTQQQVQNTLDGSDLINVLSTLMRNK